VAASNPFPRDQNLLPCILQVGVRVRCERVHISEGPDQGELLQFFLNEPLPLLPSSCLVANCSKSWLFKNHQTPTYTNPVYYSIPVSSVADPETYVFGPPGSGSAGQKSGSGSFHHQAKIVRKNLIPAVLWLLYDFLS
jgi:hypothetical protein